MAVIFSSCLRVFQRIYFFAPIKVCSIFRKLTRIPINMFQIQSLTDSFLTKFRIFSYPLKLKIFPIFCFQDHHDPEWNLENVQYMIILICCFTFFLFLFRAISYRIFDQLLQRFSQIWPTFILISYLGKVGKSSVSHCAGMRSIRYS